jgi:hypothetical protein
MRFTSLRRSLALLAATVALGTLAIAPAAAQSPAPAASGTTITVVATDAGPTGLPTTVPAGTTLLLDNQAAGPQTLLVARLNDGVTETWDELLALPPADAVARITLLGPITADPGTVTTEGITVDVEGAHMAFLGAPGDPAAPDLAGALRQPFSVTAAGTPVGPLPSPGGPPAEARVIELDANAALQFTDKAGTQVKEIAVTPGETITFKVTNTAGYQHNFYIGTDQQLMNAANAEMVGIPDFSEGTQEVTWTVPADITGLKFGCTVPGHYQIMQGVFVAAS